MSCGEEVSGELVVSGGDATPVLEAAPEALDEVSGAVGVAVIGDRRVAAAGRRDDDFGALCLDGGADGVAVIASVGDEPVEAASGRLDQTGAMVMSEVLPGEMSRMRGRPAASVSPWILLVRPPREVPIAWMKAPLLRPPPNGGP